MRCSSSANNRTLQLPLRSLPFAVLFAVIALAGFMWQDTKAQTTPTQSTVPPVEIYVPVLTNAPAVSAAVQKDPLFAISLPPVARAC